MKGRIAPTSGTEVTGRRPGPSGRKLAAVGIAGAVVGLMGAASAFQDDTEIAVATIPPATIERGEAPSPTTTPLVDVLGGSLTPEQALESCEQTLRALAAVADVTPTTVVTTGAADSVKERQQTCTDTLEHIRSTLTDSGALVPER